MQRIGGLIDDLHQAQRRLDLHQRLNLAHLLQDGPVQRLDLGPFVARLGQDRRRGGEPLLGARSPLDANPADSLHDHLHALVGAVHLADDGLGADRVQIVGRRVFDRGVFLHHDDETFVFARQRRLDRRPRGGAPHRQRHQQMRKEHSVFQGEQRPGRGLVRSAHSVSSVLHSGIRINSMPSRYSNWISCGSIRQGRCSVPLEAIIGDFERIGVLHFLGRAVEPAAANRERTLGGRDLHILDPHAGQLDLHQPARERAVDIDRRLPMRLLPEGAAITEALQERGRWFGHDSALNKKAPRNLDTRRLPPFNRLIARLTTADLLSWENAVESCELASRHQNHELRATMTTISIEEAQAKLPEIIRRLDPAQRSRLPTSDNLWRRSRKRRRSCRRFPLIPSNRRGPARGSAEGRSPSWRRTSTRHWRK